MFHLNLLQLGSPLSYLLAFSLPLLDAVFPVVPSETALIALGVATATSSDPRIGLLVGLAALGAFSGDNLSYMVGRRFAPFAERHFFSSPKGIVRRAWALSALERLGGRLIVVCRFIPGGRTAVTLTCGTVSYSHRRFMYATAAAAVIWASYAFFVGRLGGRVFADRPWAGFLVAVGIVLCISLLVETVRRIRRLLGRRRASGPKGGEGSFDHPEKKAS